MGCDLIIVPGYSNSGPDHWQSRWEAARPWARRVEQRDWDSPVLGEWVQAVEDAVAGAPAPVVLVAHSLGCATVAHWASTASREVLGALLVAPADVEAEGLAESWEFGPMPRGRLDFPSMVVASTDDPWVSVKRAREFAAAWGSRFVDVGAAGHLNTSSGHGPWPEGEALLEELLGEWGCGP